MLQSQPWVIISHRTPVGRRGRRGHQWGIYNSPANASSAKEKSFCTFHNSGPTPFHSREGNIQLLNTYFYTLTIRDPKDTLGIYSSHIISHPIHTQRSEPHSEQTPNYSIQFPLHRLPSLHPLNISDFPTAPPPPRVPPPP